MFEIRIGNGELIIECYSRVISKIKIYVESSLSRNFYGSTSIAKNYLELF